MHSRNFFHEVAFTQVCRYTVPAPIYKIITMCIIIQRVTVCYVTYPTFEVLTLVYTTVQASL